MNIYRDVVPGVLHLHPISETHQLRPSLTYLDVIAKHQSSREKRRDSDDESDDPAPDPDEPTPVVAPPKKEKKTLEAREVQVTARKVEDKGGPSMGGMSQLRRDMLTRMRTEHQEEWERLEWCDAEVRTPYLLLSIRKNSFYRLFFLYSTQILLRPWKNYFPPEMTNSNAHLQ